MGTINVQDRNVDPSFVAAGVSGDDFKNDGSTELLIMNQGPSVMTVIALAARKCSHGVLDHWTEQVESGELFRFGPFLPSRFNSDTGSASFFYTETEGVTVAAQRQKL